jgi:hypothetical protein
MERIAIDFAVHRHGADTHLFAGPDDPAGNLTAIGDQDLAKASWAVGHTIADFQLPISDFFSIGNLQSAIAKCLGSDSKKRLPVFHGLPVLDINLDDFAGSFRVNLVHQLHGFDDAHDRFRLNLAADTHEAFCCW